MFVTGVIPAGRTRTGRGPSAAARQQRQHRLSVLGEAGSASLAGVVQVASRGIPVAVCALVVSFGVTLVTVKILQPYDIAGSTRGEDRDVRSETGVSRPGLRSPRPVPTT
jgi:hypothetical protein